MRPHNRRALELATAFDTDADLAEQNGQHDLAAMAREHADALRGLVHGHVVVREQGVSL